MSNDLYREICRCPEDDTLCLAYADWLDENGDPDRAEFVRVQYSLGVWVGRGHPRESALLAAHPEWSRLPCEKCEGGGIIDQGCHCQTCSGTGDLFLARTECYPGRTTLVPIYYGVTFARGFPDSVSCTLAEAFAPDGTPTPWACEVVRRTPVTRFVPTDREPFSRPGSSHGRFAGKPAWDWSSAHEPAWLMDEMRAAYPDNWVGTASNHLWWMEFGTRKEADAAMTVTAGRLVRRHVYGEVTA